MANLRSCRAAPSGTATHFIRAALAYYSPEAAQLMLWDGSDQDAYAKAIRQTLLGFFAPLLNRQRSE
jgi:hypothetical protein